MSLDYMEQSSYSFSNQASSGVLNVSNGAMIVMRCMSMNNNLYYMEESFVIGETNIAAIALDQQWAH